MDTWIFKNISRTRPGSHFLFPAAVSLPLISSLGDPGSHSFLTRVTPSSSSPSKSGYIHFVFIFTLGLWDWLSGFLVFVVSNTRSIASRREDFNLNRFMCSIQRLFFYCLLRLCSVCNGFQFFFRIELLTAKCSLKFLWEVELLCLLTVTYDYVHLFLFLAGPKEPCFSSHG